MAGLFARRFFSSSSTAPPTASTDTADTAPAGAGADVVRPVSPGEPETFHDSSESQDGRHSLERPSSSHIGSITHSKVRGAAAPGLTSHTKNSTMSNAGSPRSASHIQRELELLRQNILSRLDSDDEGGDKDLPDPSKEGLARHQDELHGLRRQRDEADEAMRDAKRKLAVAETFATKHVNALKDLEGRHAQLQSDNTRQKADFLDRIANLEKTRLDAKEGEKLKSEAESLKTQVSNLKSTHAAELGALTKQHQESQERVKTLQSESTQAAQQIRKLQEDHQSAITAKDEETEKIQATHAQALSQIKSDHGAQLHAKAAEAQRNVQGYQDSLKSKETEYQSTLKKKDEEHQSTLKKKDQEHQATLKSKDGEHQSALKAKETDHAAKVGELKAAHESALKARDAENTTQITQLKTSHESALKAKVAQLEQAATTKLSALRAELEQTHKSKVDELNGKHRTDINARKQSHRAALQDFERRLKETIQYHEAAMAELEAKATHAETQLERERKKSGPGLVSEGATASAAAGVAGGALAAEVNEAQRRDSDIAPDEVPSQKSATTAVPAAQQTSELEPPAESGAAERTTSANLAPAKSTRSFFRRKPVATAGDADSIASGTDSKTRKNGLFRKTSLIDQKRIAEIQESAEKRLQEQKKHYEALLEQAKKEAKDKLEEYEKLVQKHTATDGKSLEGENQHEVEKKLVEAKGSVVASLEAQHAHAKTAGAISTERAEADIKESVTAGALGDKSATDAGEKIKQQKEHYEKLLLETKKAANAKIEEAFAWCEKQLASSRSSGHAPSSSVDTAKVPERTSSKRPTSGVFAGVAGGDDSKHLTQLQEDKQQLEKKLKEQQAQHEKRTSELQQEADKKLADNAAKHEQQLKQLQAKVTAAASSSSSNNSEEAKKLADELKKQKKEHDEEVQLIKRQSNAKLDEAFKHYEGLIAAAESKSKEQGASQKDVDNVKQLKKQLDELKKSNDDKLRAQSAEYERKLSDVERGGSVRRSSSRSSFFRRRFGRRGGDDESEAGGSRPASQAGSVAGTEHGGRASTATAATNIGTVPEESLKSLQKELKDTKVAANTKLDQAFAYYEKRLQTEREEANERIKQLEERHRTSTATAAA